MNLFAGQDQRCRHREQMCGPRAGAGMNWEIGIDLRALLCVSRQLVGSALQDRELSSVVLCGDLDEWDGRGERGTRERGYTSTCSCFTLLCSRKNATLQSSYIPSRQSVYSVLHMFTVRVCVCVCVYSLHLTLCKPMDCTQFGKF